MKNANNGGRKRSETEEENIITDVPEEPLKDERAIITAEQSQTMWVRQNNSFLYGIYTTALIMAATMIIPSWIARIPVAIVLIFIQFLLHNKIVNKKQR